VAARREAQHVSGKYGRFRIDLPLDAAIAALAESQHGVVSLTQLRALGLTDDAVRKRAAAGRLFRVHRGVYAVGRPRLSARGRWMAATLACGPRALLSHRSAAVLWGILGADGATPDITVPGPSVRARAGIEVHASLTLTGADFAIEDGIPCTSLARTLVDLGDVAPRRQVERAVDRAEVQRIFDLADVEEALGRAGRRRGPGVLREVLADWEEVALTDTGIEERFLCLCQEVDLPRPAVNKWITLADGVAYKADFLWGAERLIVETDGRGAHSTRKAFEHDRLRDQRLTLAGFTVIRFSRRQVVREPRRVARTVAELLAGRGPALARLARP
jgi:hypothetical protein